MNVGIAAVGKSAAWTLPGHFVDRLRGQFPQHVFFEARDRRSFDRALRESDAAMASALDPALVPRLTRLRWVQATATGVGHMLSAELVASPILITSARGVRSRAIAEHVLLVVLALMRQLPRALRSQAQHVWAFGELARAGAMRTIRDRVLGVIGLGSVGTEVSRLASAVGFRVVATRLHPDRVRPSGIERVFPASQLQLMVAISDIVVVTAPLTAATRHLIGRDLLNAMKPQALLVNVSRGALLDDQAVVEALADHRLAGAALDVFTKEPLETTSPYWDLPNVILTPHVAGEMEDYWTPLVELFANNLRRFERGEPLLNVVDKAAGY